MREESRAEVVKFYYAYLYTRSSREKREKEYARAGSLAIGPITRRLRRRGRLRVRYRFYRIAQAPTMFAYTICHERYDVVNYRARERAARLIYYTRTRSLGPLETA